MRKIHMIAAIVATLGAGVSGAEEVRVPAYTAYVMPDARGVSVSPRDGVTRWTDPGKTVNWYVQFQEPGEVFVKLSLRLPKDSVSRLKLTIAGQSHETQVKGQGDDAAVTAVFGSFNVAKPGYQRLMLQSLNAAGQPAGNLTALLLDGPAAGRARFFTTPAQRGAPSVHLGYRQPSGAKVVAFYCEVTAVEDPVSTYYMACGWQRGYFGMQVNSPTERRIIFSVWDSGGEPTSRGNVSEEDRVKLVAKGEGVFSGDFGNEGTGGHSHLVYNWKTGESQRFIVVTKPVDDTHAIYSGYWFHPEKKQWMLISSWKAPKAKGELYDLYSFSEDFAGSGIFRRKALFGNQWVWCTDGKWREITEATFSHTGGDERFDRCMGVENGQFYLAAGAFVDSTTEYGKKFTRPLSGRPPPDINLPPLPFGPK